MFQLTHLFTSTRVYHFAALNSLHKEKNIAQFISDEYYSQRSKPQVNWQILHLSRKKSTFLFKPLRQSVGEAEKKVNVCVTMWIIVTPSPRRKPCASCSKNNRKWPGIYSIIVFILKWCSAQIIMKFFFFFVGEDTACVSWRFACTSPNVLSAKLAQSPLSLSLLVKGLLYAGASLQLIPWATPRQCKQEPW